MLKVADSEGCRQALSQSSRADERAGNLQHKGMLQGPGAAGSPDVVVCAQLQAKFSESPARVLSCLCCCCCCCADALPSVVPLPGLTLDQIPGDASRCKLAAGFALLQLQRGQIVVTAEDLSTAPDWQVKAYQSLKLLLPMSYSGVAPDHLDFVIYSYFNDPGVVSVG